MTIKAAAAPGITDFNRDLRGALGLSEQHLLILQPTRVVPRKGIELSIQLVQALRRPEYRIEISGPGRYHATVVIVDRERNFYVPHREFDVAELEPHAEAVMAQLRRAEHLYFYEYDGAGNKIYTGLRYHDPARWQVLLDGGDEAR